MSSHYLWFDTWSEDNILHHYISIKKEFLLSEIKTGKYFSTYVREKINENYEEKLLGDIEGSLGI